MQEPGMKIRQLIAACGAALLVVGCATPGLLAEQTVGERFRRVLAAIDAECKQDKLGPYLDRSDPEYRRKVAITSCDILKLEPRDWRTEKMVRTEGQPYPVPERWLATAEGRFAHSIRLPPPHDRPKDVYRPGMSGKEYFEALCREEAGEFVFQSVKDVDVVFEARPRREARSEEFFHLYAFEDPYGYTYGETAGQIGALWTAGNAYRAIERARDGAQGYVQIYRTSNRERLIRTEAIQTLTSRYGFVWRGITRPKDREHGIAGGELIVFDLQTKAVLGFRRGFSVTGVGHRGVSWEFSPVCPKQNFRGGRSKDFDFGLWFLSQVLQPRNYAAYRREISGQLQ